MKCDCFHKNPGDPCTFSQTPWIILFGCLQLVLSQIQDIDRWRPFPQHHTCIHVLLKPCSRSGLPALHVP